jgi:hypothetical protein
MTQRGAAMVFTRSVCRGAALMAVGCAALAASEARSEASRQGVAPGAVDASRTAESVAAVTDLLAKDRGRVLGQVQAASGGPPTALPGAVVALKDATGQDAGETARSDVEGHFEIPSHPPGTYRLCAAAPGFTPKCAPRPLVIAADT